MSEVVAWTPGPWRVDETKSLGAYGVWTDYATHPGDDGSDYPIQICSMLPDLPERMYPRVQRDANAKLIAAAPDLLAACRQAAVALEFSYDVRNWPGKKGECWDALQAVKAALAKAGVQVED